MASNHKTPEPVWTSPPPYENVALVLALNWYRVNVDDDQVVEWARRWANQEELDLDFSKANRTNVGSIGPFYRMKEKGFVIDDELRDRINQTLIDGLPSKSKEAKEDSKPQAKKPVKPIFTENPILVALEGFVDGAIDGNKEPDPTLLVKNSKDVTMLGDECRRRLDEVEQNKDYYHGHVWRSLKVTYSGVLKSLDGLKARVKSASTRKASKSKPPAVIARDVRYLRKWEHLESVNPAKLVGAKKAFVYDTESRKLIQYGAADVGFTFTGTTLKNLNVEKCTGKTIRKPEVFFKGLENVSMSTLNKAYKGVAAKDTLVSGRFNEHMIILAVS